MKQRRKTDEKKIKCTANKHDSDSDPERNEIESDGNDYKRDRTKGRERTQA